MPPKTILNMSVNVGGPDDSFHMVPRPSQDGIVCLDVGGVIYRTFRSTLVNASAYFTAMFRGNLIRPAETYTDANGLTVYFIDRNGPIFQYILKYLRNQSLPIAPEDRQLWRNLREEAEYYALDDLLVRLRITIEPNRRGQGVLHWLGTRRGTTNYQNPYETGGVDVTGWIDEPFNQYAPAHSGNNCRKTDVQYQPEVNFWCRITENRDVQFCSFFAPAVQTPLGGTFCSMEDFGSFHTDIVINTVTVKPTHYSLRFSEHKLCSWDFLGSVDGEEWIILHQARREHVPDPTYDIGERFRAMTFNRQFNLPEDNAKVVLAYAEKYFRRTFGIDATTADTPFCRYFRFRKVFDRVPRYVYATGFELYGEVKED